MKWVNNMKLVFGAIALGMLWPRPGAAAEPAVELFTANTTNTAPVLVAPGRLLSSHLRGSISVNAGYDDNVGTQESRQGSATMGVLGNLSYVGQIGRAKVNIVSGGGVTYYLKPVNGRDSDVSGSTNLSLTYPVSLRLVLSGNLSATYQSEPDFASDVGLNRRAGNFFRLTATANASYRLSLRVSTVSSYSFAPLSYEDTLSAASQDRIEQTFGEELLFRWSKRATLTGSYLLTITDYDVAPLDSITQTVLVGTDYRFSTQLRATARAGASFRSYDSGDNQADPNFAGTLSYIPSGRTSLSLNASYSIANANTIQATNRTTFRTGLAVNYLLTFRISANLAVNYIHDENDTRISSSPGFGGPAFSQDAFEGSLGLSYVINRRFALNTSATHSEVISGQTLQSYSRNRYSLGLSVSF